MLHKNTYSLIFTLLLTFCISWHHTYAQSAPISSKQVDSLVNILPQLQNDTTKADILKLICSNHPNVDSTLKYAQELYSLSYKTGKEWTAAAYTYIGWYYQQTDKPEDALKYYFKAFHINDSLNLMTQKALNCNAIGEILETLGNYGTAIKYLLNAMELLMANNNPLITYTYRDLGILYMRCKIYNTAQKYFNDALKIDSTNKQDIQILMDHYYLAISQLEIYEDDENAEHLMLAKTHSDKAIEIAQKIKYDFYIQHALLCAIQIHAQIAKTQAPADRDKTLDTCWILYNKAIKIAKTNGFYEGLLFNFEHCKFQIHLIEEDYDSCQHALARIDSIAYNNEIYIHDMPNIYNLHRYYNLAVGNYKEALNYAEKHNKAQKMEYDPTFTINSIKSNANIEYDIELRQHKLAEQKREIMFNERQKHMHIIIISISIFLIILSILAFLLYRNSHRRHNMNVVLLHKKDEIKRQRDKLADANYEATSSIRYANQIQTAIVPSPDIINSIFGDSLILWNPVEIVSGDFYWATQINQYRMLAVADCTGHGVPGAFMSMLGLTSLNDIITSTEPNELNAAEILNKLRKKINEALHQNEKDGLSLDGMDIALIIIDNDNMQMQYAGAYIPLILIRDNQINMYYPDRMTVGYNPKNHNLFTNNIINIQPNDSIYMYTDGITNQFSSEEHGNKYSSARLNELFTKICDKPFSEQSIDIENDLIKWRTSSLGTVCRQTDDQLVVGIRI